MDDELLRGNQELAEACPEWDEALSARAPRQALLRNRRFLVLLRPTKTGGELVQEVAYQARYGAHGVVETSLASVWSALRYLQGLNVVEGPSEGAQFRDRCCDLAGECSGSCFWVEALRQAWPSLPDTLRAAVAMVVSSGGFVEARLVLGEELWALQFVRPPFDPLLVLRHYHPIKIGDLPWIVHVPREPEVRGRISVPLSPEASMAWRKKLLARRRRAMEEP